MSKQKHSPFDLLQSSATDPAYDNYQPEFNSGLEFDDLDISTAEEEIDQQLRDAELKNIYMPFDLVTFDEVDEIIANFTKKTIKFGRKNGVSRGFFASDKVAQKLGFVNASQFREIDYGEDLPSDGYEHDDIISAYNGLLLLKNAFEFQRSFLSTIIYDDLEDDVLLGLIEPSNKILSNAYNDFMVDMELIDSDKIDFKRTYDAVVDIDSATKMLKSFIKSDRFAQIDVAAGIPDLSEISRRPSMQTKPQDHESLTLTLENREAWK